MGMAYADNDGLRVHYRVEGDGPPLIMQHGFTDSLETWYELGYVDGLKREHRLILIDARGHGGSDKPHRSSAYASELRASDIVAVLQALEIPRADFFGYSMGGWIGFCMARHAPERVRRLVLGGNGGEGRSRIGDPYLAALRTGGAAAIRGVWRAPLPEALVARLLTNDVEALMASRVDSLGFADVLPRMTMRCLLYAGSADSEYPLVEETAAEMPNAAFFGLPGLGHAEAYLRSDLVLPRVLEFLASKNQVD
jgi:pimeloyl-ACP methyl ester carboxylesterase